MASSITCKKMSEDCQPVRELPDNGIRVGVLRYKRESDNNDENDILTEYPENCEYCAEIAEPSLKATWARGIEANTPFCCGQWQQLCITLVSQKLLLEGKQDPKIGSTSLSDMVGAEMEKHHAITREAKDQVHKFNLRKLREQYEKRRKRYEQELQLQRAAAANLNKKELNEEEKRLQIHCDHKPLYVGQFGICYSQGKAEFLQKYYYNGMKFLTLFPDGSAQVFYPSGLLALVVVVTEDNGSVCIVYDDKGTCDQQIRAIFQSDGRATCYHSNGNIWMTLNPSGGQCLDNGGTRVRCWSWSSPDLPPTLHPVFLSLNKAIGVRVLGRTQVFVSFLARGQKAKCSVGSCCSQECIDRFGPSVSKEELFVLAARIRIQQVIQHIHECMRTPLAKRRPKTKPPLHIRAVQRLVNICADVMSESERAFIQRCLQDHV